MDISMTDNPSTRRPANDDMVEGYIDGSKDDRDELPATLSNRSRSYRHGWLNGRDDRMRNPRARVAELRDLAQEAMRLDQMS